MWTKPQVAFSDPALNGKGGTIQNASLTCGSRGYDLNVTKSGHAQYIT